MAALGIWRPALPHAPLSCSQSALPSLTSFLFCSLLPSRPSSGTCLPSFSLPASGPPRALSPTEDSPDEEIAGPRSEFGNEGGANGEDGPWVLMRLTAGWQSRRATGTAAGIGDVPCGSLGTALESCGTTSLPRTSCELAQTPPLPPRHLEIDSSSSLAFRAALAAAA